jgi:hypothetical protein
MRTCRNEIPKKTNSEKHFIETFQRGKALSQTLVPEKIWIEREVRVVVL